MRLTGSHDNKAPNNPGAVRAEAILGKKKTRTELELELRLLRRQRRHEGAVAVLNNLIRWGGLVGLAYFAYRSVEVLAGGTTVADIGLKFLADVKISQLLSYTVAVGGGVYGWRQRKLRRDTVERLQGRIKELEKSIDPQRTSSGLTTRGATNPEDA